MIKRYLLFWIACFAVALLPAQVTVVGTVTINGDPDQPIGGWPVALYLSDFFEGDPDVETVTEEDGSYVLSTDATIAGEAIFHVVSFDICTVEPIIISFDADPNNNDYLVDIALCGGINPPPGTDGCEAHFSYELVPNSEPYTVQFFDLSFFGNEGPESYTYEWSFGDGTGSNEANPTHEYDMAGLYDVLLTISNDSCSSTVVQLVNVADEEDCGCEFSLEFVCVTTPSGEELTFPNACFAECAGFTADEYEVCDGGECGCPEFYAPVCVTLDNGETITFTNHCFAECEGYTPDQWEEDCEEINECDCPTDEYDPVCVVFPWIGTIEFVSACWAECEGFEPGQYQPCDGCNCPDIYAPVCVTTADGEIITFNNFCEAQCEGYSEETWTDCGDCMCTEEYDPVCVATPGGQILTFDNSCYAECEGYGSDVYYSCEPCECNDIFAPVCVTDDEGNILAFFPNACEAECAGFGADQLGDCGEECPCPEIYVPVCVVDVTTGEIITFENACFAACEGYGEDAIIPCEPEDCTCPDIWDPVCVNIDFLGFTITFGNACEAECEGFGPDDFVDCDEECVCDDFYDPVCAINPATGEFEFFGNACFALCAGYGAEDLTDCDNPGGCFSSFDFSFGSETEAGFEVFFFDQTEATDEVTSWFWDFGDGNTSTEQNPTHVYAEAGVFDVTLTIESPDCGTQSVTYHICVGDGGGVVGPSCQAFFFFEQPDPDNLLTYQFINFSIGGEGAVVWDFGDGNTSTELNPLHTYATEGEYLVTLSVLEEDCQSNVQILVTTGENVWYGDLECRAWFLPIISAADNSVFLINLSSFDAQTFTWDFGDGNTSTEFSPFYTYAEAGTYTITLTVGNEEGECENTFSVTVTFGELEGLPGFDSNPSFLILGTTSTDDLSNLANLTAAPNPTNDLVNINWQSTGSKYSWQLLDLNGRLLQSGKERDVDTNATLQLDLSAVPAGVYFFRLQTREGQQTIRLSKL